MNELILMKLGGSLITDKAKPFTEDLNTIKRLAKEIHEARAEKEFDLIVGHGGGSYPHVPAHKYQTQKGIINPESYRGIALVQDTAAKLNRIIVNSLIEAGENAVSIQPSASCIAENSRIIEWYTKPIESLLKYKMLPVPYGDVAIDIKKGCCILSTEELLNFLAKRFKAKRIIVAGVVGGVFTADPQKDPSAELIPKVTLKNFEEIKEKLGGSAGIDVTGGMLHKVEEMLELVEFNIESQIIDATKYGLVKKALLGEAVPGTIISK